MSHDDVNKWKYFRQYWPTKRGGGGGGGGRGEGGEGGGDPQATDGFVSHRSFMFCLSCAWINGRANNREAGDLRYYPAYYDATVMRADDLSTNRYSAHPYPVLWEFLWLLTISNTYLLVTRCHSIWPTRSLEISQNLSGLFNQPFVRENPPVTNCFLLPRGNWLITVKPLI